MSDFLQNNSDNNPAVLWRQIQIQTPVKALSDCKPKSQHRCTAEGNLIKFLLLLLTDSGLSRWNQSADWMCCSMCIERSVCGGDSEYVCLFFVFFFFLHNVSLWVLGVALERKMWPFAAQKEKYLGRGRKDEWMEDFFSSVKHLLIGVLQSLHLLFSSYILFLNSGKLSSLTAFVLQPRHTLKRKLDVHFLVVQTWFPFFTPRN